MPEPSLKQRDGARRPSFAVPGAACDCHAHVIGDRATYPFSPHRSFTPAEAGAGEYFALLDILGIERMIIVQPSVYGLDNSCTLAAIAAAGLDRARGVAAIESTTDAKTLRALHGAGIRGVRFITIAKGGAALGELREVAELIAPFNWHIQLYIPADALREMAPTIMSLPVDVVIDHMGQLRSDVAPDDANLGAVLRLLDAGRCWVKLCGYRNSVAGYPYSDVAPLARRLVAHAPERCLWGSDWPHINVKTHMPDDGELLDLLLDWAPAEATRNRILVTNPALLYGFAPGAI